MWKRHVLHKGCFTPWIFSPPGSLLIHQLMWWSRSPSDIWPHFVEWTKSALSICKSQCHGEQVWLLMWGGVSLSYPFCRKWHLKQECSSESLSHSVLAAVMVFSTKFLKVLDSTWKWPNTLYLELDNKISLVYHFKWKANSALPAKNINALLLPAFADVMSKNGLKIGNSSSEIPA